MGLAVTFGILNGFDLILDGTLAQRIVLIGGGSRSAAWRQLIADSTGAVIDCPTEEEAGCLGAAMQAMHAADNSLSFPALAKALVHTDSARTARPNAALREAYRGALSAYRTALAVHYPASAPMLDSLKLTDAQR